MSTQSFDADRYKAGQRQQWDQVAAGWKKWWPTFEQGAQHLSDRLVELANIQPGQRVLDVATGIGEPAVTAARRVGPTGHVIATDQAPQMLAIAQDRAAELGLQHIEFLEMDAEALDLPESSFDAILCRWGLMFLPNLASALNRMWQLLTPGGRLAAAVWDVPEKVPNISLAMGVARQMLRVPPPPGETPGPFSLADSTALELALTQAGFSDLHSEWLTVTYEFASAGEFVRRSQDIAAPLIAMLADRPTEWQAEVWRAIEEAAHQYAKADGSISMPNETICIVGRR